MYDLHLSAEQLETRDMVRAFVERELKPVALHPDRLQTFDRPVLLDVLDRASRIGLRTFALSEAAGGAGADTLTACIVLEELAVGDADVAVILGHTSALGRLLFDELMTEGQRQRLLPDFRGDHRCHLAFAGQDQTLGLGWCYRDPRAPDACPAPIAVRQGGSEWVIRGEIPLVANAPLATLFAVQVRTDAGATGANGLSTLLVPRSAPGLRVGKPRAVVGGTGTESEAVIPWYHGTASALTFDDCRVPSDSLLGPQGRSPLTRGADPARAMAQLAAINLGVGRAAYEAALDYAKVRRQGGRSIIEHEAIGALLADSALKLDVARTMIWKAAWVTDHPDAVADRSVSDLPFHLLARRFTAEGVHEVTTRAAECFGAMGVMRDMPLQKYVHDGLVFLHSESTDAASGLPIAEALAGHRRASLSVDGDR